MTRNWVMVPAPPPPCPSLQVSPRWTSLTLNSAPSRLLPSSWSRALESSFWLSSTSFILHPHLPTDWTSHLEPLAIISAPLWELPSMLSKVSLDYNYCPQASPTGFQRADSWVTEKVFKCCVLERSIFSEKACLFHHILKRICGLSPNRKEPKGFVLRFKVLMNPKPHKPLTAAQSSFPKLAGHKSAPRHQVKIQAHWLLPCGFWFKRSEWWNQDGGEGSPGICI